MPKLSIISNFYNCEEMAQKQVENWKNLPAAILEQVEFILVDDCSDKIPDISPGPLNLRLFRVISDIPWNLTGARNLGAFNATGDWSLFFDIDQYIFPEALASLTHSIQTLDAKTLYYLRIKELINIQTGASLHSAPSTMLVNTKRFRTHGMFDEDFAGYYGYEDIFAAYVWETNGGRRELISTPVFFEDMGFGTTGLDRDVERNKALLSNKLATNCQNSPGILRFIWKEIELA